MIRIVGLHKRLGGRPVLNGVDLDVREGETLAIMGPSGTGKSVLLKHIVGLFDPDAGDILVDGISVPSADRAQMTAIRTRTAYVFQNSALFDSMTVRGNLLMGLPPGFCRGQGAKCDALVLAALDHVNLDPDVLTLLPAELSGGMQRRVAIARAIIGKRRYVLYDEPTTGLDPVNATRINRLIARVSEEVDATSIVVTHDVESAFYLADRIVLLSNGVVAAEGTPRQLRETDNPDVREFLDAAPVRDLA